MQLFYIVINFYISTLCCMHERIYIWKTLCSWCAIFTIFCHKLINTTYTWLTHDIQEDNKVFDGVFSLTITCKFYFLQSCSLCIYVSLYAPHALVCTSSTAMQGDGSSHFFLWKWLTNMQASYGSHEILIWERESTIREGLTTPRMGGVNLRPRGLEMTYGSRSCKNPQQRIEWSS